MSGPLQTDQPPSLKRRAKQYAMIIRLLYGQQGLTGSLYGATRGARHVGLQVRLGDPLKLDQAIRLAEPLALSCGVNAVMAQRYKGVVSYQIELPTSLWEYYTRSDLPGTLGVGLAEQRRLVQFDFDPPHALVAGTTGAGKTETVKSILVALTEHYTPADLGLVLIDPNRELEEFDNEAHLLVPAVYKPDQIRNTLTWVDDQLVHRKRENIKDGPKIVVVVEEGAADEVLGDDRNKVVLQNIGQEGRKYQVHLILGTQKPTHKDLPGVLDKLLDKWVGQLSDAKTSANVTGHAGLEAHKLTSKGDFLHINGPVIRRFQVAMATQADYDNLTRKEVQPVTVSDRDIIDLPATLPEPDVGGRPPIELNAKLLAKYFYYGPPNITEALARELFGVKRTGHILHRDFCSEFAREFMRLRRAKLQLGVG